MVKLALGSVRRTTISPTGGATSPAGHHLDFDRFFPVIFFSRYSMASLLIALEIDNNLAALLQLGFDKSQYEPNFKWIK